MKDPEIVFGMFIGAAGMLLVVITASALYASGKESSAPPCRAALTQAADTIAFLTAAPECAKYLEAPE